MTEANSVAIVVNGGGQGACIRDLEIGWTSTFDAFANKLCNVQVPLGRV